MNYCNVNIDVDLFEYKSQILLNLSNDELKNELTRREESSIIIKEKTELVVECSVDLSDFDDEILEELTDCELETELSNRDIYSDDDESPLIDVSSRKEIAQSLGLREWATKEQIFEELNFIL